MSRPQSTGKPSTSNKVQSLEQQNDIYRNLFAQAGMKFPERKHLENFKIPKLKCPNKIRLSNEKYEYARHVVDYGREPEPKLSYGRPPGWKPPKQEFPPPPFHQVPSPQTSNFGSVSVAGAVFESSNTQRFAENVAPIPSPNRRWTRSAIQRYKDYSFGSVVGNSSDTSSTSSFASVSSVGAIYSPKSSIVSGGTFFGNRNFPPKYARKHGKASSTPSGATSTTSCSSPGSGDTEIINYNRKLPPSEENPHVEDNHEQIQQLERAGVLLLPKIEIPEQPTSTSGYNSNGNGDSGHSGGSHEEPEIDLDTFQISDNESEDFVEEEDEVEDEVEDDDLDVLIIGLSKKERKEVKSWNKILKNRKAN